MKTFCMFSLFYVLMLFAIMVPVFALSQPENQPITATGYYERMHRVIIDVTANQKYAGSQVVVKEGRRILGKDLLRKSGNEASAALTLPMPALGKSYGPLKVIIDARTMAIVNLPDATLERQRLLYYKNLKFEQYVFSGDRFPRCEFEEPAVIDDLIGRYQIKVRYLDSTGKEVTTPTGPGRYGAIVEVLSEIGKVHRRFATLYRTPQPVDWGQINPQMQDIMPGILGVDPNAVDQQTTAALRELVNETIQRNLPGDGGAAILFAGLHEHSVGNRFDAWQRNDDWWFAQRKQHGLIEHRYDTLLPKDYEKNPDKRYPLIIFLHGAGERGLDVTWVHAPGPWQYVLSHPELGCILVAPQCDPQSWWMANYVDDFISEVLTKYRVDPDRVYLTGLSMGGFGTWAETCAHPERFAAVAPICGGGDPTQAPRMKDVPTWVFHGAKDSVVPFARSQEMVDALKAAGSNVKFTVYPEADHDSWSATYSNPEFYAWLLAQRRNQR
jgi:predicted esterase